METEWEKESAKKMRKIWVWVSEWAEGNRKLARVEEWYEKFRQTTQWGKKRGSDFTDTNKIKLLNFPMIYWFWKKNIIRFVTAQIESTIY